MNKKDPFSVRGVCNYCTMPCASNKTQCHSCNTKVSVSRLCKTLSTGSQRPSCEMCWEIFSYSNSKGRKWTLFCSKVCQQRAGNIKIKYGVAPRQYREMYREQAGVCAMPFCFSLLSWISAHIDHCHKTGVVRGLLCSSCNSNLSGYEALVNSGVEEYLIRGVMPNDFVGYSTA